MYSKYVHYLLICILSCACKNDYRTDEDHSISHKLSSLPKSFQTTNGISLSLDGSQLYISKETTRTFASGKTMLSLYTYTYDGQDWSGPEEVDLKIPLDAYHPVLSIDNQYLYFNSRSDPDSLLKEIPHNIWYCHRLENKWGPPTLMPAINTRHYDSYPSIAASRSIYFNSDRPGGKGGMDIYYAHYSDTGYLTPVNVEVINSPFSENDLVVDPLERFIIFNRYIDSTQSLDLYISAYQDGHWLRPIPLQINSDTIWELTPTLSPDLVTFMYEVNGQIMQYSLDSILTKLPTF